MDKIKAAYDIITHALPLAAFEGWNQATLNKAAALAGYKKTDAIRVFPNGAIEAVDMYFRMSDAAMLTALQRYHLDTMKIRERIATAVRLWLEARENDREALRRALALHAQPQHTLHAVKSLYHTVDEIWHAAGDTSTDFNFYTKRMMLAGVFSTTLLFWLNDQSPGYVSSWAFLDRRIENVMQIEKAKYRAKHWFAEVKERFSKHG